MTDSGYDSNSAIIPRRASGYSPGRGGVENAGFIHMTVPQGAGALYSTTGDLPKMGAGSIRRQGAQAGVARKDDHAASLHAESESVVVLEPDDKLAVVVLANLNGPAAGDIADKLAAVARGEAVTLTSERKEITLDSNVLMRYVGAYQMPDGGPAMLIALVRRSREDRFPRGRTRRRRHLLCQIGKGLVGVPNLVDARWQGAAGQYPAGAVGVLRQGVAQEAFWELTRRALDQMLRGTTYRYARSPSSIAASPVDIPHRAAGSPPPAGP